MTVAVNISKAAQKDIASLPVLVQVRVQDAILGLAAYPQVVGVKALKGSLKGQYRVRVGSYRVVFTLASGVLTVVAVDDRKDVY
jgi:mRNA interferase RelE/StbE